ncbi:MAG: Spy/CpxP family protein refolding chaperone [Pseudolabrys sp.]
MATAAGSAATAAVIRPNEGSAASETGLGWAGPTAWRNAYGQMIGFTFWPDEFGPRLRGHGFNVIADSITGHFQRPREVARAAMTGAAVQDDSNPSVSGQSCNDTVKTADNWLTKQVEQTSQLSRPQRDALQKLQAAMDHSIQGIKSNCRDASALAPPDRLQNLVDALWASRDAAIQLREPLKAFYDMLTPQQKNSFVPRKPQTISQPGGKTASADMDRQYRACAPQNAEAAERLIKKIEMSVRPTEAQAASLENLHKTSSSMAKLLIASCAQPPPSDRWRDSMPRAINSQVAFNDFYQRLDDNQKIRFDGLER